MYDKVLNLIKMKDFTVPRTLIFEYKKLGITEQELVILIYLINNSSNMYNPKEIANDLNMDLVSVLSSISSLTEKGIVKIDMQNREGRKAEILDLAPLYDKLTFTIVNEEKEEVSSIYSAIEKEFARALSPLEYDLVSAWLDAGFTEELIEEALKEAIYNNVTSLKYIDKILDNWSKKNIKTKKDVIENQKKFRERKNVSEKTFDYDWLNEEE